MSWSVNRTGMPAVVAAWIAKDLAGIKCAEPEETIKNAVAQAVAAGLAAMPRNLVVVVAASGSQYAPDSRKPEEFQNTLFVDMKPLYGFVEAGPAVPVGTEPA